MDRGLTQHTLAERLGLSSTSVALWERDLSEPLAARWPTIEGVLGTGLVPERDGLSGRVRTARLRRGLTQEALARRAGVHVRTIRNTELGHCEPSRKTLDRFRQVLDLV